VVDGGQRVGEGSAVPAGLWNCEAHGVTSELFRHRNSKWQIVETQIVEGLQLLLSETNGFKKKQEHDGEKTR